MNHLFATAQKIVVTGAGASMNPGPSLENLVFDPTYYGLTALVIVIALVSAGFAFRIWRGLSDPRLRDQAMGAGLAAIGFAIVFVSATSFLALLRSGAIGGFLYQQAQFLTAYVGTAIILYGVDRTVIPRGLAREQSEGLSGGKLLRAVVWAAFAISTLVAVGLLFDTSAYTVTNSATGQHVAQQGSSWIPPFVALVAGASGPFVLAFRRGDSALRRHWILFGLFFVLEIIGILRESKVIPSSGDPLVDLLAAFVPFTLGCFSLLASVMSIRPARLASPERTANPPGISKPFPGKP